MTPDTDADADPTEMVRDAHNDTVNHPSHYTSGFGGHEVIEITEWLNFNRGNAVKYICRAGVKDPDKEVEDLEKARWYLTREIARVKGGK